MQSFHPSRPDPDSISHIKAEIKSRRYLVFDQGADEQVTDLLAFGRFARSSGPRCPNRLFDLRRNLYDNPESDSITTLFRGVSDAGLRYTPKLQTH
jgi:hypothetical protein